MCNYHIILIIQWRNFLLLQTFCAYFFFFYISNYSLKQVFASTSSYYISPGLKQRYDIWKMKNLLQNDADSIIVEPNFPVYLVNRHNESYQHLLKFTEVKNVRHFCNFFKRSTYYFDISITTRAYSFTKQFRQWQTCLI